MGTGEMDAENSHEQRDLRGTYNGLLSSMLYCGKIKVFYIISELKIFSLKLFP